VVLGPSSTLAAVGAYGRDTRTLTLQGEAFFEVTHDERCPFIVRAGPAVVRDLGTAFVVRAGEATGRTLVAVTQGSVALTAADPAQPPVTRPGGRPPRPPAADTAGAVLLRAGDRGLVDRPVGAPASSALRARRLAPAAADPAAPPAARTADDLAWTTGRLVFRDAPLAEVADGLRRWYGLTLRVADPALAGRTLTASFQNESADEVLRAVTLALGARAERRGDTVVVRAGP
jgi:transmembrane sensor